MIVKAQAGAGTPRGTNDESLFLLTAVGQSSEWQRERHHEATRLPARNCEAPRKCFHRKQRQFAIYSPQFGSMIRSFFHRVSPSERLGCLETTGSLLLVTAMVQFSLHFLLLKFTLYVPTSSSFLRIVPPYFFVARGAPSHIPPRHSIVAHCTFDYLERMSIKIATTVNTYPKLVRKMIFQ